jgi:hypothetical protein
MPARSSFGVSAYNGYLYVTGGLASASSGDCTATAFACNGVFYAPINASGTIGDWSKSGVFSTTIPMPARSSFGSIVYNGYLYVMGGTNSVTSGDCSSTYCKGVFYAQILTAGNIDPNWYASANALSQETLFMKQGEDGVAPRPTPLKML